MIDGEILHDDLGLEVDDKLGLPNEGVGLDRILDLIGTAIILGHLNGLIIITTITIRMFEIMTEKDEPSRMKTTIDPDLDLEAGIITDETPDLDPDLTPKKNIDLALDLDHVIIRHQGTILDGIILDLLLREDLLQEDLLQEDLDLLLLEGVETTILRPEIMDRLISDLKAEMTMVGRSLLLKGRQVVEL